MEPSWLFPQTVTKKENQEQREQQTKRRTEPKAEPRKEEPKQEKQTTEVQRQEEQRTMKERTEQEQLEMEQLMEWSSEGESEGTTRKNSIASIQMVYISFLPTKHHYFFMASDEIISYDQQYFKRCLTFRKDKCMSSVLVNY